MDTATGLTPLLIDAKREYVGQLTDVLAPYVINHIQALYLAAAQASRNAPVLAFQRRLREIQQWNGTTIQQQTAEVQNKYSFLSDLIAACFVAYVKILSSVKLHQQKPNIRLRLPSNDTFVHKVYIHTAREFYANPAMVKADRGTKVTVVRQAVEASVRDMLPIEDILKAYLGNTVDSADHTMNPAEMADDMMLEPQQDMEFGDMQMGMMAPGIGLAQAQQQFPQQLAQQLPQVQFPQVQFPQAQQLPQTQFPQTQVQVPQAQFVTQPQQVQTVAQVQPVVTQATQVAQPTLFGAAAQPEDDAAPKQISLGGQQQQQQFVTEPVLFSDAEDEF